MFLKGFYSAVVFTGSLDLLVALLTTYLEKPDSAATFMSSYVINFIP